MKRLIPFALCAFICALPACKPCKQLTTDATSETRVETRYETVFVPDTVLIEIPAQSAERLTRDTTSFLETDFARSTARIMPDGFLFHRLENKPQLKPAPFQKPVEKRDSIVYIDREKKVQVPVIVEKKIPKWQQFQIDSWWWLLGTALLSLIWNFRKPLFSMIRRFI